jgi:uroporphyrinogen decarboxylase
MAQILEEMPSDILVLGNISPAAQFHGGTPESIYNVTTELLKECSKHNNFVISSGCDIPPMSPWANIDSFFKAVEDFYQ